MADPNVNLPLKLEIDIDRSFRFFKTALETHGPGMVKVLEPRLSTSFLEGEACSLASTIDQLNRWLGRIHAAKGAAGRSHRDAKAQRAVAQRSLTRLQGEVRRAMIGLRRAVVGTYGPEAAESLGLPRYTPRRIEALLELVKHVASRLSVVLSVPEPIPGLAPLDLSAQAEPLQRLCEAYEGAVEEYHHSRRLAESSLVDYEEATRAYRNAFVRLAGISERLFLLADQPRQANFVRPAQRAGVLEIVANGPSSDESEPTEPIDEPIDEPQQDGADTEPEPDGSDFESEPDTPEADSVA